ncbi:LacI family DNA-binding transcriptional regulator [Planotetraspora kaengkrachanensis]|uniref:LacI family transcriptional regulator n=2 Tax=Planotetraspora kaengkrachanensis TaxID=575193 RepID=A0A8J3LTV4_9ACTN|nr:LacI family transcriptional regulator [Planotetraspora kaengkrachanensis]
MTPAAKRVTSADVAQAAGVSRTTVSFVLNDKPGYSIPEETRRRILEAAERLDYRPRASARSLAAGRSDIVLLAVPDLPIGAGISRFIEELAGALAGHGLTMVTHLAGARGRPLPDVCAAVDASVVIGFDSFDEDTVQALYRAGADVVLPARAGASLALQPIGRLQADHLIGRGHRRLGYAMPEHPDLRSMAEARLDGVVEACLDAGLERPVVLSTSLEIARAAQAVAGWTERSVTGVCAFNDETAIAVLAGMREHGLAAPGDLAVVGVDDIPTARLAAPPITTVCFDLPEVARHRAEEIVAVLSGRESPVAFTSALLQVVPRSST